MADTAAILDRLRTERKIAENGNNPILARSFALAIGEIERLAGAVGPFICGTVGTPDTGGLHDGYVICPQFGSDYVAVFMQNRAKD